MAKVRIIADSDPMNPRTEWDNLGTIAYKHSRYTLGEEEVGDPIEWLASMLDLDDDQLGRIYDKHGVGHWGSHIMSGNPDAVLEELEDRFFKEYIAKSLYLYDHSGITMNTSGFSCPWDSGKVGYIYVSKEKVRKEYGWKNITKSRREKIEGYLDGEVETFDQYLRGDVYGFIIEDEDGEETDSCWGFFGDDPFKNGMSDHIPEELHEALKEAEIEYGRYA